MAELSDFQKETAAKNIVLRIGLADDLGNLKAKIDKIFTNAPIESRDGISKTELEDIVREVKAGTASNVKNARLIEIASKLGI